MTVSGAWPAVEKTKLVQASPDETSSKVAAAIAELLEKDGFAVGASGTPRRTVPTGGTASSAVPTPGTNPYARGTSSNTAIDDGFGPPPPRGASVAAGPPGDQVLLKDGTTMRGRVVKQEPGTFVTLETADGAQHTVPWERVREVVVAPKSR